MHQRAFAPANPVPLAFLDGVAPVQPVQPVQQFLGIGRNPHAPLHHLLLDHGVAAAFRKSVFDFVVGQHRSQCGAPVHPTFRPVGQSVVLQHRLPVCAAQVLEFRRREVQSLGLGCLQPRGAVGTQMGYQGLQGLGAVCFAVVPAFEQLAKNPLRPPVIFRLAGPHLAAPVKTKSNAVQLLAVPGDVGLRGNGRVLARLNGILLGGQAESVVPHGVQHVKSLVPFEPRHAIRRDVAQRMPDVQSRSGRVGKHIQDIELG